LFGDGSVVKVEPGAKVIVDQKALPPGKKAETGKTHLRSIRVTAGRIWADVKPSRVVATEFELPSAVASVRGTQVSFDVPPPGSTYLFNATAETGQMDLTSTSTTMEFRLEASQGIEVSPGSTTTASGEIIVRTTPGTAGQVVAKALDGTRVIMDGEDQAAFWRTASGAVRITNVGRTSITIFDCDGNEIILEPGQSFMTGVPEHMAPADVLDPLIDPDVASPVR
jgi:hypothetical protein